MNTVKQLLDEVENDIRDILSSNFELITSNTQSVPSYEDCDLTFERGQIKKGKNIDTCVLFIDIRNSVALNNTHRKDSMAKLYSAFAKSVTTTAYNFNGAVRNIIGDRVMVVFQPENCFKNAMECAITLNTICRKLINKYFQLNDFKCGIGIAFGNMRVIKVGIQKQGAERASSKNLIWVGDPANVASRLTDIANKDMTTTQVKYSYETFQFYPENQKSYLSLQSGLPVVGLGQSKPNPKLTFKKVIAEKTVDLEIFIKKSRINEKGDLVLNEFYEKKVLAFSHVETHHMNPAILITEKVYTEYKKLYPDSQLLTQNFLSEQNIKTKDYHNKIYGGGIIWKA
ncbi:adenylate/guanylate cyclase domain-containing protein [Emticicia fontis]